MRAGTTWDALSADTIADMRENGVDDDLRLDAIDFAVATLGGPEMDDWMRAVLQFMLDTEGWAASTPRQFAEGQLARYRRPGERLRHRNELRERFFLPLIAGHFGDDEYAIGDRPAKGAAA